MTTRPDPWPAPPACDAGRGKGRGQAGLGHSILHRLDPL